MIPMNDLGSGDFLILIHLVLILNKPLINIWVSTDVCDL